MRPMYETSEDLENEATALSEFCRRYQLSCKKVRVLDGHTPDATFWRDGERVGVGEVKVRTNDRMAYPTYLISKAKLESIWERWHPLPIVLIVQWTDDVAWVAVTREAMDSWDVQRGGRTDRADDMDIEDCYLIPVQEFHSVRRAPLPS